MNSIEAVWVARDQDGDDAYMFVGNRPIQEPTGYFYAGPGTEAFGYLPIDWFPDLKPGECRRVTLILEVSDA